MPTTLALVVGPGGNRRAGRGCGSSRRCRTRAAQSPSIRASSRWPVLGVPRLVELAVRLLLEALTWPSPKLPTRSTRSARTTREPSQAPRRVQLAALGNPPEERALQVEGSTSPPFPAVSSSRSLSCWAYRRTRGAIVGSRTVLVCGSLLSTNAPAESQCHARRTVDPSVWKSAAYSIAETSG